ncbi:hypothetical protein [Pseudooceanicola aestuarii]|uniref:hypothetical protein n=1 Tax=Pseudooceanicola aestuarii TaxID=2697319 RepID=UPI0013D4196B|nr:hypothetical protein [Pseudooceanicola aestuarii]
MSDYWNSSGQSPAVPVLRPTPGDALDIPYVNLLDTPDADQINPALLDDARSLFPYFDGETHSLPIQPANFANPAIEDFTNWHSAHQLEYLRLHGTQELRNDGDGSLPVTHATIGTATDPAQNLHILLSADGREVITVNDLQFADIAALPLADQRALSTLPAFASLIAVPFDLDPAGGTATAHSAREGLKAVLQTSIDSIAATPGFLPVPTGTTPEDYFAADPARRETHYHYLFIEQLQILQEQLDGMAIFHADTLLQQNAALFERFERVDALKTVTRPVDVHSDAAYSGYAHATNSDDELASIDAAAGLLIGAELTLLGLQRNSQEISRTGTFEGKRLDTPTMTFLLQTFQNYRNENLARVLSEELNQYNSLLSSYTAFQRLLNTTLQAYDPVKLAASEEGDDSEDPEELGLKGANYDAGTNAYSSLSDFTEAERRAIAMFDSVASATGGPPTYAANTYHPIETLQSLTRPTERIVSGTGFESYTKSTWDTLAVNIAEATKLINQDTQLKMDEINALNRQKNRHYDMASNALNKMADILRAITY